MMVTTSEQFITQMKLRELRKQRDQFRAAYAALAEKVARAEDDAQRVVLLYGGLQAVKFANQPLHPEVANLEPVLHEIEQGHPSVETIAFWRAELEQELTRGGLRSEIVYIFGALLEEWAIQQAERPPIDPRPAEVRAELLERICTGPEAAPSGTLLQTIFSSLGVTRAELATHLQKALGDKLRSRVTTGELEEVLKQLSKDLYRPAASRRQAQAFLLNKVLLKEFADALTIMLEHLDEWDWPEVGVPAQARWARHKWRLFVDDDLPTACLVEILGMRWQDAFTDLFERLQTVRLQRIGRLVEWRYDPAGELIPDPDLHAGIDIWASGGVHTQQKPKRSIEAELNNWGEYGSIFAHRAKLQRELHTLEHLDGYNGEPYTSAMEIALRLINADIRLASAAFPDRPLYVLKVDLKDFYPSIPHDLLLSILTQFGLSEPQVDLFRRFLRIPVQDDGQVRTIRRGVPNSRRLSHLLGEIVLRLLDQYIRQSVPVQIVRLVDDICLITPSADHAVTAWQAVQAFCEACGLSINLEKCGAACIGGARPPALPSGQPNWLLLTLDNNGEWGVDQAAFGAYVEEMRQQITQASSVIARVELYNSHLAYLATSFAIRVALGDTHRRSVDSALTQVHTALFDEKQGIVEALRRTIHERFLEGASPIHLPEAWFYWPITAGGLGLTQASVLASRYAEGFYKREDIKAPEERPDDWQRRRNNWARFYASLLAAVRSIEPAPRKVMETLVADFIARGAELSDGEQTTLSAYWRWILYIYGPQILSYLGTFRFLITELVPLQLITQWRLGDTDGSEPATQPV